MALFWFCCSVGDQLPLRGWLYDYIPPTRYFRNPGWFREYAMLCLSVLALLALRDIQSALCNPTRKIWPRLAVASLLISGLAVACYIHFVNKVEIQTANYHRSAWFLAILWTAAVIAGLLGLFRRSRQALPVFMVVFAVADVFLTFQISRGTVSSAGPGLAIWKKIDKLHNPTLILPNFDRKSVYKPFRDTYWHNKNIPLKVPTFINDDTMRNRFQMDFWDKPVLMDMSTGEDRIWFSNDVALAPPTAASYAAFVERSEALNAPVLIVHPPDRMKDVREQAAGDSNQANLNPAISRLLPAQRIQFTLLRYSPNHLDIRVTCPAQGWLLVTDRWARGWTASVNGKSAPVFGGNFIFRAVRVQPGINELKFSYRPFGFPYLLLLSWGTLLAVFTVTLRTHRMQKSVQESDKA
jgi:hypothetical protein